MILREKLCAEVSTDFVPVLGGCDRARSRNNLDRTSRCTIRGRCRRCRTSPMRWEHSAHRLRTGLPAGRIVGKRLRRLIAPGKLFQFQTSTSRELPFCLCGQAELARGLQTQPLAVPCGLVPGDASHRLLRMTEVRICPERRRQGRGCTQEFSVLCIRDLRSR